MSRERRAILRSPATKDTDKSVLSGTLKYPGYDNNRAPDTTQIVQDRTQSGPALIQACSLSYGYLAIKKAKKLLSL